MSTDRRTYIRVHDGMPDHPKIDPLSDAAFRLLLTSWCWSSRNLTDGRMPLKTWTKRGSARARAELVAAGLAVEHADAVELHDYLLHQRSKQQVEDAVEQRRAAGARGGQAKARRAPAPQPTASETGSESLSESPGTSSSEIASPGLPETETQVETEQATPPPPSVVAPPAAAPRSRPKTRAPQAWPLDPDHAAILLAWSEEHAPAADVRRETEQWLDFHRAKGTTAADWTASWRTWMRNAQKHHDEGRGPRLGATGPPARIAHGDRVLRDAMNRARTDQTPALTPLRALTGGTA